MIEVREHGTSGPFVVALHGGPAAAGSIEPVARALGESFRVLEPFQRGSGDEPLSVARHVADLDEVIAERCEGERPAVVGESWGAMLALAYAAAHPARVASVALIGCGTFDTAARARMREIIDERLGEEGRRRRSALDDEIADPEERLEALYGLIKPLYDFDPVPSAQDYLGEAFDDRAHRETWEDMIRLQEEGVYPAAFAAIEAPVLMLHGAYDPHPGRMILEGLAPLVPQIEYREWEECGHSPWAERRVRDEFLSVLRDWLALGLSKGCPG